MGMILAADIGNTNITMGVFEDDRMIARARISANTAGTEDEYAALLLATLSLHGVGREDIDGAILSSVVPPLTATVREAIRFVFGVEALTVGPGIKTGINIHCDHPASVGTDLICACVAVHALYGAPALIIDLGTATKMTVMDRRGAFVGVAIMPGLLMGLRALADRAAQLPQVSLEAPGMLIAKNTADSMRAGVIYGHAAMIDGMIDRFAETSGEEVPVYATGELAPTVIGHCRHAITHDDALVLRGLCLLYRKNVK